MPTLHNPTNYRLFCHELGRLLEIDEKVEITERQAEQIAGHIFVIEAEPSDKPTRETVKRGGKRAEVTKAPARETR